MLRTENECVGCPQGCINCGRKRVAVWYCDVCGRATSDPDEIQEVDGKDYCDICYRKMEEEEEGEE